MAIFFLDLDRFKRINDTLGHAAGDQLLQAVAERLRNCVRSCDFLTRSEEGSAESIVARLGGDEFIVVLSDIMRAEDSGIVARGRSRHSRSSQLPSAAANKVLSAGRV